MLGSFRNLIKLCRFSKNESDNGNAPLQQVEYLGKAVDAIVVMPYGSHANIPEDFMAVLLQLSTQEQNRVVLPLSLVERPHPIESGEVVYYHPITGSKIHFKNNGDIDITTEANVNVNCDNANVTCLTKATVTAPNIDLTGDVNITGTLDVSGISTFASNVVAGADVAVTGALSQGGTDVGKDHGHSQDPDSAGNTQVDTDGVV